MTTNRAAIKEAFAEKIHTILNTYILEHHDDNTYTAIGNELKEWADSQGLEKFVIVCDDSNNKQKDMLCIDFYYRNADMENFICLNASVARKGVTLEEAEGMFG